MTRNLRLNFLFPLIVENLCHFPALAAKQTKVSTVSTDSDMIYCASMQLEAIRSRVCLLSIFYLLLHIWW